jgi:hypothetical protein
VTLVSSIITDAFREGNILPLGREPNAAQAAEALRLFNANIRAIYGGDAGERLVDWPLGSYGLDEPGVTDPRTSDQIQRPGLNSRLIATNASAITVYLPTFPQDGARMAIIDPYERLAAAPVTVDGNGRPIENAASVVLNTNGASSGWFYRADLAEWFKLASLIATDENPFPDSFDMFFIIGLAMRLNPRYGREMDAQTAMVFKSNRREFIARYLQSEPLEVDDSLSWPFMTTQGYDQQRAFSSNRAFNRGWYGGP